MMAEPIKAPTPPPPTATSDEPVQTIPTEIPPVKSPPKRRRRIGWLISLIVVVGLIVAGLFVADSLARDYAEGYVRDQIVEVLNLDPDTGVDVDLGTGSLLVQAAAGSINAVTIDIEEISFGTIAGPARITGSGVPLDSTIPVDQLAIQLTFTEEDVRTLASFLSSTQLKSIELSNGLINVSTEFSALFITVPVAMGLQVSAVDGGISFEPQTVTLGSNELSVADLRNNALFSGIAEQFLKSRDFCVASYLPAALRVTEVNVIGESLTVLVDGSGVALSDPAFSTLGTCPAA